MCRFALAVAAVAVHVRACDAAHVVVADGPADLRGLVLAAVQPAFARAPLEPHEAELVRLEPDACARARGGRRREAREHAGQIVLYEAVDAFSAECSFEALARYAREALGARALLVIDPVVAELDGVPGGGANGWFVGDTRELHGVAAADISQLAAVPLLRALGDGAAIRVRLGENLQGAHGERAAADAGGHGRGARRARYSFEQMWRSAWWWVYRAALALHALAVIELAATRLHAFLRVDGGVRPTLAQLLLGGELALCAFRVAHWLAGPHGSTGVLPTEVDALALSLYPLASGATYLLFLAHLTRAVSQSGLTLATDAQLATAWLRRLALGAAAVLAPATLLAGVGCVHLGLNELRIAKLALQSAFSAALAVGGIVVTSNVSTAARAMPATIAARLLRECGYALTLCTAEGLLHVLVRAWGRTAPERLFAVSFAAHLSGQLLSYVLITAFDPVGVALARGPLRLAYELLIARTSPWVRTPSHSRSRKPTLEAGSSAWSLGGGLDSPRGGGAGGATSEHLLLGVSLRFLRGFAAAQGLSPTDPTSLVARKVRDLTTHRGESICERCRDASTADGHSVVAPANLFVCHAQACSFLKLLDAVDAHLQLHSINPEQTYIWLDVFSIRQHEVTSDVYQIARIIKQVRQVVMVLDPWDAPLCLTRVWCLYEVAHCVTAKPPVPFHIAMAPEERHDCFRAMRRDPARVARAFNSFDARTAKASVDADREMIFELIRTRFLLKDRASRRASYSASSGGFALPRISSGGSSIPRTNTAQSTASSFARNTSTSTLGRCTSTRSCGERSRSSSHDGSVGGTRQRGAAAAGSPPAQLPVVTVTVDKDGVEEVGEASDEDEDAEEDEEDSFDTFNELVRAAFQTALATSSWAGGSPVSRRYSKRHLDASGAVAEGNRAVAEMMQSVDLRRRSEPIALGARKHSPILSEGVLTPDVPDRPLQGAAAGAPVGAGEEGRTSHDSAGAASQDDRAEASLDRLALPSLGGVTVSSRPAPELAGGTAVRARSGDRSHSLPATRPEPCEVSAVSPALSSVESVQARYSAACHSPQSAGFRPSHPAAAAAGPPELGAAASPELGAAAEEPPVGAADRPSSVSSSPLRLPAAAADSMRSEEGLSTEGLSTEAEDEFANSPVPSARGGCRSAANTAEFRHMYGADEIAAILSTSPAVVRRGAERSARDSRRGILHRSTGSGGRPNLLASQAASNDELGVAPAWPMPSPLKMMRRAASTANLHSQPSRLSRADSAADATAREAGLRSPQPTRSSGFFTSPLRPRAAAFAAADGGAADEDARQPASRVRTSHASHASSSSHGLEPPKSPARAFHSALERMKRAKSSASVLPLMKRGSSSLVVPHPQPRPDSTGAGGSGSPGRQRQCARPAQPRVETTTPQSPTSSSIAGTPPRPTILTGARAPPSPLSRACSSGAGAAVVDDEHREHGALGLGAADAAHQAQPARSPPR